MEITEVKVFPVEKNEADEGKAERLKGFASIIFDDCFIVRDLRIINGNNGLFVAMPSRKTKNGSYKDMAHPLNSDMRDRIESAILKEYRKQVEDTEDTAENKPADI